MVGKHEHRCMKRRSAAPPALPGFIGPRSPHRSKHVPAHYAGSDLAECPRRKVVVNTGRAARVTEHLPKRARRERPVMQGHATHAKRLIGALIGSGAEAVDGYREIMNAKPGHPGSAPSLVAAN